LNSAYARLSANAIAGSSGELPALYGGFHRSFFGHKRMFEFQMIV
jgi:hypothetical protein